MVHELPLSKHNRLRSSSPPGSGYLILRPRGRREMQFLALVTVFMTLPSASETGWHNARSVDVRQARATRPHEECDRALENKAPGIPLYTLGASPTRHSWLVLDTRGL
ncbi:hypothetical protein NDU88_003718 [Pleurodeles waltl]|uniref:Uncharacterized protein n=1 Tax=Pleurodeles waltl TaxID=8319 RepID=A0AAV7TS26_PLEWA|nr:hypothetical protein NDU88_003718 [Pleurodeles waltl]